MTLAPGYGRAYCWHKQTTRHDRPPAQGNRPMAHNSKKTAAHKRYTPAQYATILRARHGQNAAMIASNRASAADMNGQHETATFYERVEGILHAPAATEEGR